MSVGEFTASNIAMDQDMKDLDAKKKGVTDYAAVEADIKAQKDLAKKVRPMMPRYCTDTACAGPVYAICSWG